MSFCDSLEMVLGQAPADGSTRRPSWSVSLTIAPASSSSVQRARPSAGSNRRWRRTCSSLLVSLRSAPARGSSFSAGFEIAFNEAALGPVNGRAADSDRRGNSVVAETAVGEQNCLFDLASVTLAAAHQRGEFTPLGLVQFDMVAYVHPGFLANCEGPSTYSGLPINRLARVPSSPVHRQARSVPGLHLRLQPYLPPTARGSRHAAALPSLATQRPSDGAHPRTRRPHQAEPRRPAQHRASDRVRGPPGPPLSFKPSTPANGTSWREALRIAPQCARSGRCLTGLANATNRGLCRPSGSLLTQEGR